jgi:peptidoglycan/xylan/chitin deacetylase (PgdA/CDA1 family)
MRFSLKSAGTWERSTTRTKSRSTPTAAASYRILESGSTIGNHTYTHPVLPKLDQADLTREIDLTSTVLTNVLKSPPVLFRPPYGAANANILSEIQTDKMKTVIWNVDSEDWADPVPNSVAQRVITEVEKQQRGIILFHDIHKVGIDALPTVIETLQADGYNFVSWNGTAFGPPRPRRSTGGCCGPATGAALSRELGGDHRH